MTWPILPGDFREIKAGTPIELQPIGNGDSTPPSILRYFLEVDDKGLLIAHAYPPSPEDVQYVEFRQGYFGEVRILARRR
jgi:hypothetical protein